MTEPISTSPELMREVAASHDAIAEQLDTARAAAGNVSAAVESWGAIMYRTKLATTEAVTCYAEALAAEAASHREAADRLRGHAAAFEQTDADNSGRIGGLL